MKARAKMQLIKEERAQTAAATASSFRSRVTGGFAAKIKLAPKCKFCVRNEWHTACSCGGIVCLAHTQIELKSGSCRDKKRVGAKERAVLMVQARWRAKKGQFAYHLKQKALRRLASTVDDWVRY